MNNKLRGFFAERPLPTVDADPSVLRRRTRRDVLLFGAGAAATLAAAGSRLPGKERLLNTALRIDDDVAETLYSPNRTVPTYTRSQITPIRNNYNGATPNPGYIPGWHLNLNGLASGVSVALDIRSLMTRFSLHEQITRLVCVEGWSAIAWWSGLKFDDLLRAYPPVSQAKWARVDSSVNLDASGNPDPYYVSIDLATARHPQTLLATHLNGQPLRVEHGAPLRLLAPVKLGLKNVKAVTNLTYVAQKPRDYWFERGYSYYDGI
jgi:DMSO/TMAO reductase YedYZ molybdopterin-dependent catalytic subunit